MRLPSTPLGWAVWLWGIGGVLVILLNPIIRLTGPPLEALEIGLSPLQWGLTALWVGFMVYAEGYRGFHKQFSPRVVVRGLALAETRPLVPSLFAPLMCMGLIYANRKRKIVSWSLLTGIALIILVVRQLPAPWRGMIDIGVVLGLSVGVLSILFHTGMALMGRPPQVPADLPAETPS